jgi:hypothetical protein
LNGQLARFASHLRSHPEWDTDPVPARRSVGPSRPAGPLAAEQGGNAERVTDYWQMKVVVLHADWTNFLVAPLQLQHEPATPMLFIRVQAA